MICFRWPLTKSYVLWFQLLPYAIFGAVYLIYTYFIFKKHIADLENEDADAEQKTLDLVFGILLIVGSAYFLYQERKQWMKKDCKNYLGDFWNYTDVIPPVLILVSVIWGFFIVFSDEERSERSISILSAFQGVASFGMWVKIFYFLRIFRHTGYFVNMLTKVIRQSAIFFLLLTLIILAFACSFFIISSSGRGILLSISYSYLLGLGEFDMEWEGERIAFMVEIFFFLGTLLIQIVMFNILIAIVSTAYDEVIHTIKESNDFERVGLIADLAEFIKPEKKEKLYTPGEYLIVAKIAGDSGNEEKQEE